ncbi:MAG: four-carbon acid sugar kinase family protein [Geminicoccaceae bacterium]|nr:four-carbon acid sugar kinase family protein [Geminicoccaceae bacterium]
MAVVLGSIADDFTGATDLCNTLVRQGMRTVQLIGVPDEGTEVPDADAVTIALKSRTVPAGDAVAQSLAALSWLRSRGARQILFKYCSTFDSTDKGNIGPVADALLETLADEPGSGMTVVCPAFPETGRTIYNGYLFIGEALLSETHMRHHPLTPMTDSSLVRVLQSQTSGKVGLVPHRVVAQGPAAVRDRLAAMETDGYRHAILDAIADDDLMVLGEALADRVLITGGSGIAMGLPRNYRRAGLIGEGGEAAALPPVAGRELVLAGSCSAATLAQIEDMRRSRPALQLTPDQLASGYDPEEAAKWALERMSDGPVLIYASAESGEVARAQERFGRERAGQLVEDALAAIARIGVDHGVGRLVVAGGETSGAVIQALGITGLRIGPQIDPGVPACVTTGDRTLAVALKSGNFGGPDFLTRAFAVMP